MTAISQVTPSGGWALGGLLETIAITNQTADSTAVSKYITVPPSARYATFVVNLTMTGTTPTFDFNIRGHLGAASPDDADLFLLGAGWDGITQKTGATDTYTTVHIGPDIATDDTGSATASDAYGVGAPLPPILAYTYTTTGVDDDEDYSGTISVSFRR